MTALSPLKKVLIIGYGSQAKAWSYCLNESLVSVEIFLHQREKSYKTAKEAGFSVHLIGELPSRLDKFSQNIIAYLCPDTVSGSIYREFVAPHKFDVINVLAHGYAKLSNDFKTLKESHKSALFAPKAIGPKIKDAYDKDFPHSLKAAIDFSELNDHEKQSALTLSKALGFKKENLIETSFKNETVADLISEQMILCGTLFSSLIYSIEKLKEQKIPMELIEQECISEIELIAQMLKEKGIMGTFNAISAVAQEGTFQVYEQSKTLPLKSIIEEQSKAIDSGIFHEILKKRDLNPSLVQIKKEFITRLSALQNKDLK